MLTARAKIAKLTAKLVASPNKKERAALAAQITKLMARLGTKAETTKKSYRLEEEEETTSDEEEEEEEEGNETDREEEDDEDKKPDAESDDEEEEASAAEGDDKEPPEKKEKKAKAAARAGRIAALEAKAAAYDGLASRLASIEAQTSRDTRAATIRDAVRTNRITPAEAKTLAKKPEAYIEAYLEARPRAIVLTPEEALRPLPHGSAAVARENGGSAEAVELTDEQQKMLVGLDPKLAEQVKANWAAKMNGAREGRY